MSSTATKNGETRNIAANKAWEGLGGPIQMDEMADNHHLPAIDPTLATCCQREEKERRLKSQLTRTLDKFDVVSRNQRYLVECQDSFRGCRCCYDPNSDGGEYHALIEYRKQRLHKQQLQEAEQANEEDDDDDDDNNKDDDYDEEFDEFDYLLDEDIPGNDNSEDDDDEELKILERARRQELEQQIRHLEIAKYHGFGVHVQLHPNRVLLHTVSANNDVAVVWHLYDPDSHISASLDWFFEQTLAPKFRGTKFVRSGGRSTLLMNPEAAASLLPSLRPDSDLPALVAIRNGQVVNVCRNLEGLVDLDRNEIVESAVEIWLDHCHVLVTTTPKHVEDICRIRPDHAALLDATTTANSTNNYFDCGNPNCQKTFPHEHVGEKYNEQQNGLIISEQQIIGDNDE